MGSRYRRYRLILLISMVALIPIGYGARFYLSPELEWLRNLIGNIAYECFWILLVAFLVPRLAPWRIAVGVCLASFGIEILQLWQTDWLRDLRQTLFGKLVLGNSFYWPDFLQYILGSLVGWLWLRALTRRLKILPNGSPR